MLKKTLIASALTLGLVCGTSGVQANPLTNAISGFINGAGLTDVQFDARRGGGARRSSSARKSSSSSRSSSKAVTTTNNKSNTSNNNTNNQQQQDAQFSQNARTGNTNNANTPATTPAAGAAAAPAARAPGVGSTFVSSLAGAGAGVLLANMLLSPSAAAAEGTEVATPDMLSDDQINDCLSQIDKDIKDVEAKLLDTPEEEQAQLREQLSQMNNLKITLKKEQINRLQQEIQASSNS